ncbi:MAG: DNA-directed RNA polymerase subunit omega [Candidatus Latescibacterota bacterium]|nr:MAG: DNA-directed RNA polymerase subunit omega [Candidatus Latescibacterota bacterium]
MKDVVLIEKLTTVIPNKYEAVRVIAKEARRINSLLIRSAQGEIEEKPTMMALKRLLEDKVKYQFVEPNELPDLEAEENE